MAGFLWYTEHNNFIYFDMKRKKAISKKQMWIIGGVALLGIIAIFFAMSYSGALSLAAFPAPSPGEQVVTKLDCSISNINVLQAIISIPGTTASPSQLNNLRIAWSNDNNLGFITPQVSTAVSGGVATALYLPKTALQSADTVRADFLGGWFYSGSIAPVFYAPSSCTIPVSIGFCAASTGSVHIDSLSPATAKVGQLVQVKGTGFTATGNDIHFAEGGIKNAGSVGGTMLTFTVPSGVSGCDFFSNSGTCTQPVRQVQPGTYDVYVKNANGTSNTVKLTVSGVTPTPIAAPVCAWSCRIENGKFHCGC